MSKVPFSLRLTLLVGVAAVLIFVLTYYQLGRNSEDNATVGAPHFRDRAQNPASRSGCLFWPASRASFSRRTSTITGAASWLATMTAMALTTSTFSTRLAQTPCSATRATGRSRMLPEKPASGWAIAFAWRNLRRLRQLRPSVPLCHQHARWQRPFSQPGRRHLQGRHGRGWPDSYRPFPNRCLLRLRQ